MRISETSTSCCRKVIALAAAGGLLGSLTGCSTTPNRSSSEWLSQTAVVLDHPVEEYDGEYFTQLYSEPPGGSFNPYRTATALAALGPDARGATQHQADLEKHLDEIEKGTTGAAPPLYIFEMIARANIINPFLDEQQRRTISESTARLIDEGPTDAIDLMTVSRTLSELDAGWSHPAPTCDASEPDVFVQLSSLAATVLAEGSADDCRSGAQAWASEKARIATALAHPDTALTPYDCDVLNALMGGAETDAQRDELAPAYQLARLKLAAEQVAGEPTSCLAAMQIVAHAGEFTPPALSSAQEQLMRWQLEGGGPPAAVRLSGNYLNAVQNLFVAVDATWTASESERKWLADTEQGRVQAKAFGDVDVDDLGVLLESSEESDRRIALRVLAQAGASGCEVVRDESIFRAVAQASVDVSSPADIRAYALALTRTCTAGASTKRREIEVERSETVLADIATRSIADIHAAQAALCVLSPEKMLAPDVIWETYSDRTSEYGGVMQGAVMDIEATLSLTSLLLTDSDECRGGKTL